MFWSSAPARRALCRRHSRARQRQRTGCGERVGHWRHQRLVRRLAVIPRNPLAREEGIEEEPGAPLAYLRHEMDGEPADARLLAFLQYGPEMIDFFRRRTAVQFLSGSKMPDFHASPGAALGGRSVTAQPFDGRLLGDWLHRLRPPLETISLAGMGIAGGTDMAHFLTPPAHRARRYMRSAACCVTAGSGCAPVADSIWLTATRWSPACCVRRWMQGLIFSLTRR